MNIVPFRRVAGGKAQLEIGHRASRQLPVLQQRADRVPHFRTAESGEDTIHRALKLFDLIETGEQDFERAQRVQRALAGLGLKGRKVPDLLIAAVAERADLTVLHYDRDFDLIAKASGQATEWIVPAGSID